MNDPKKLAEQKAEHKRMKRLRARFDGRWKNTVKQPGFSFGGANKEEVKAWRAAW